MRNISILAGAAALALAGPALAQGKGHGGGGGGQKGGGGSAKVERGGGGPKNNGGGGKQMRGGGGGGQQVQRGGGQQVQRGGGQQVQRGGGGQQRAERQKVRGPERREARAERFQRAERGPVRQVRAEQPRGNKVQRRDVREVRRDSPIREVREVRRDSPIRELRETRFAQDRPIRTDRRDFVRVNDDWRSGNYQVQNIARTGLIDGCPPGLAAKNNGCLPPGQARRFVGAVAPAYFGAALLPPLYRSWYPDNDDYYYRTHDDYVYRIDRDRNFVDGYFPLYNDYTGSYYVGAAYPQEYLGYYNVPVQYQPWYTDTEDDYYRYGDGAIYQVDRQGGLIESIVSLLAGDLALGQPLPTGYDAYNVPYAYRDRYADTDDAWYRYNDGNIYQVDPTTQIVQAIVESLV